MIVPETSAWNLVAFDIEITATEFVGEEPAPTCVEIIVNHTNWILSGAKKSTFILKVRKN
jgi:hypothetical protein